MDLSGHTTPFAVLGHPIGHTLSPVMHNAAFSALNMNAVYLAFDVHPDRLMDVLPAMQAMGFGGVNLTVPLKEVAFRGLSALDPTARMLGAVNTVAFTENGLKGYNTDGEGFVIALREAFDTKLDGLSVFVLGSGGAGRAVALTCASRGAGQVVVTDLDEPRAERLAEELRTATMSPAKANAVPPETDAWHDALAVADLVIQATPVGMKPGQPSLLPAGAFRPGQLAYDLIYMYPETAFMQAASKAGARTANGLGLLLHQGAYAFKIWTGQEPPCDIMREALEARVYR
jgi:shikimate dehydrogenase